jgi:predicted porin
MKKSLLALAVLGAFAGAAQAQTNVTIYGQLDVGLTKSTGSTTAENAGDNNKLGFKGTEDLGGGLAALFQAEIRFDPNTGKTEGGGTRPLFQGSSVVGLTGGFGTLRLGRALTAMQSAMPAFDPYGADRNRGAFFPSVIIGTGTGIYSSTPLEPTNSAANRFSNGVFYSTPNMGGFQGSLSLQTKQKQDAATLPDNMAFSAAGTYFNGPIGAGLAYEKNALGDHITVVGGSYKVGTANLMATYSKVASGDVAIAAADTTVSHAKDAKSWSLGTNVEVATGNVLAAYGQSTPDVGDKFKKFSIGYEHRLSKRTFLYTDYIRGKADSTDAVNTFDVGLHHNF